MGTRVRNTFAILVEGIKESKKTNHRNCLRHFTSRRQLLLPQCILSPGRRRELSARVIIALPMTRTISVQTDETTRVQGNLRVRALRNMHTNAPHERAKKPL